MSNLEKIIYPDQFHLWGLSRISLTFSYLVVTLAPIRDMPRYQRAAAHQFVSFLNAKGLPTTYQLK